MQRRIVSRLNRQLHQSFEDARGHEHENGRAVRDHGLVAEADVLEQRDDQIEVDDALVHRVEGHARAVADIERVGETALLLVRVVEVDVGHLIRPRPHQRLVARVGRVTGDAVARQLDRVLEPERLNRECPPGHGQDLAATEVLGEAIGVDGRGHEDEAQVGSLGEDVAQCEEQEVAVELPLAPCQLGRSVLDKATLTEWRAWRVRRKRPSAPRGPRRG